MFSCPARHLDRHEASRGKQRGALEEQRRDQIAETIGMAEWNEREISIGGSNGALVRMMFIPSAIRCFAEQRTSLGVPVDPEVSLPTRMSPAAAGIPGHLLQGAIAPDKAKTQSRGHLVLLGGNERCIKRNPRPPPIFCSAAKSAIHSAPFGRENPTALTGGAGERA